MPSLAPIATDTISAHCHFRLLVVASCREKFSGSNRVKGNGTKTIFEHDNHVLFRFRFVSLAYRIKKRRMNFEHR